MLLVVLLLVSPSEVGVWLVDSTKVQGLLSKFEDSTPVIQLIARILYPLVGVPSSSSEHPAAGLW